jgi:phosphatidylinositol alpha-1,6-mannosyltransferase
MARILLVTNDFPPRRGGIQSYLENLVVELVRIGSHTLTVYAPKWKGDAEFDERAARIGFEVVRHPTSLMIPEPSVARRMRGLIADRDVDTVWFGAAAPLALLSPLARGAGARRVIASTHGHEVGWSMLPLARTALRRIGNDADVVTFISQYTRSRFAAAFGPDAALECLAPGVDTDRFEPDSVARAELRARHRLGGRPVIVCVSRLVPRKGQDTLIAALPAVQRQVPDVRLLIVGDGPYAAALQRRASASPAADAVVFTGPVPHAELPAHYVAGDVFAMPCRTRGGGLDVEGLGIVFLEASACGLPVVAGDSGGAPEAVLAEQTGVVVDGRDIDELSSAIVRLLDDPSLRARWGEAGRRWVRTDWNWQSAAGRLAALLNG